MYRTLAWSIVVCLGLLPACTVVDQTHGGDEISSEALKTPQVLETTTKIDYVYDPKSPYLPATKRFLVRPAKADEMDDIRYYYPENYAITEPPANIANVRPMVEWEPMKSLVLQWPSGYLGNASASQTMLDIAKNASTVADVWIITDPGGTTKMKQALQGNGVSPTTINNKFYFMEATLDSIWFIDSGPLPIIDKVKNSFAFADFKYYHERPYDDGVPTALGRNLTNMGMASNTATYRMPVNTEGGTIQATSDGICFTGTRQLFYMTCDDGGCDKSTGGTPSYYGYEYVNIAAVQNHAKAKELKTEWKKYLGCKDVIVTPSVTDDGTGHLDMYFKVVNDNTLLIGEYKSPFENGTEQQQNAQLLDEAAQFLSSYTKPGGGKFKVHRMIMPGHRNTNEGKVPFTYLNSTFINGLNLWPAFTFPEWETSRAQAQAKWEEVMPNYTHIWINSETLSFWSGAIHCITRTIPDLSPGPWVTDGSCSNGTCQAPANGYDGVCKPNNIENAVCWGPEWLCSCNNCEMGCNYTPEGPPPAGCGGVSYEGCCDGSTLKYCEGDQVKGGSCGDNGCGWEAQGGYYNCGGNGADPSGANPIECPGECTPQCNNKVCGDNGCGGVCGTCGGGQLCNALGQCEGVCSPQCANKNCGADGCGGICGTCEGGQTCSAFGQCEAACVAQCANKQCGADGCGGDCGSCNNGLECENGQCVTPPDPCGGVSYEGCCDGKTLKYCENGSLTEGPCDTTCGWDAQGNYYNCGGNGADPSGDNPLECPDECVAQCDGKQCGANGCGGYCGSCGAGEQCSPAGVCEAVCNPSCEGLTCGGDGCGGTCGTCGADETCTAGQCVANCTPACGAKVCGDDGCGDSCGTCGANEQCSDAGLCEALCTGSCDGKVCGDDGCGGTCGKCGPEESCDDLGQCVADCTPLCGAKVCGDDGCGGSCGACLQGTYCDPNGVCVTQCTPDCSGKVCGDDGCGDTCGACDPGLTCDNGQCTGEAAGCGTVPTTGQCQGDVLFWCADGVVNTQDCTIQGLVCDETEAGISGCVNSSSQCQPNCSGKACGDDGCGGACGSCTDGQICSQAGLCTANTDNPDVTTTTGGQTDDGCAAGGDPSIPLPMLVLCFLVSLVLGRKRFVSGQG